MHSKILILFFLFFYSSLSYARPGYFEPWGKDAELRHGIPKTPSNPETYSIPVQIADVIIQFHQKILSPVDGPRSHYRPTSSRYMQLAMYKHGFVKGFIMGCDRLLRENKAAWVYRSIEIDGQRYKYDPVRK